MGEFADEEAESLAEAHIYEEHVERQNVFLEFESLKLRTVFIQDGNAQAIIRDLIDLLRRLHS